MKTESLWLLCVPALLFAFQRPCAAQSAPKPPQIVSVTPSGVNTVTSSGGEHGLMVSVGAWSGTYRVAEPRGSTSLRIVIDVNDGGQLVFSHWLQTFDTTEYDWANVYLDTPTGRIPIATNVGGIPPWEPPCCKYYSTPGIPIARSLNRWKNQQVALVVDLVNDGYGDQTQMNLVNVDISGCGVPWPPPLSDPDAINFENGNTLRVDELTADMRTALSCLQTAIRADGGRFEMDGTTMSSAFRNPEYQAHLQEIWRSWNLVQKAGAECSALKDYLRQEISRHQMENLRTSPAGRSGPHTQGNAVDLRLETLGITRARLDQLTGPCNLARPFPQRDPVHVVLRPPQQ